MNRVEPAPDSSADAIQPLPGEPGIPDIAAPARRPFSRKALLTIALVVSSLIAASAFSIQRLATAWKKSDTAQRPEARPAVATTDTKTLDLSLPPPSAPASAPGTRIPAIVPIAEDTDPIGIRRSGPSATNAATPAKPIPPEDAPAMLVSSSATPAPRSDAGANEGGPLAQTRRNLEAYERRLQALLDSQNPSASSARESGPSSRATPPATPLGTGLFGGQLQGSATPRASAAMLSDRSLVMPKGTVFSCALKTKVVSAASGFVGCQVQRNVFGDDGRVLLVERGSHLDGEYRVTSVKPGTVRIPVLWTRIRTPNGVTVDLDSPGTGPLGESGVDGYVDNRWPERIGAALLLSLISDGVELALQHESSATLGGTVILPSTTASTGKLAEKVLDSTINIPPLIYQNQGGIVGIYVARDVDFSSVYELKPVPR